MNITATIDYRNDAHTFRAFLSGVFSWMGIGLALTAFIAYFVYATPSLLVLLVNQTGVTGLGYVIAFAPLGFVLLMSWGFNRLSYAVLVALFLLYAGIMGASLSFIFLIYTNGSIYSTFIAASVMFGGMGLIGYTTKTDLTKMGNILIMALVGIIVASLVNMFMQSDSLSYIISFISVIVFCGLTAWDIQKLKIISEDASYDTETKAKLSILGALTLYLDFINLFLSLLRLFGNRKSN